MMEDIIQVLMEDGASVRRQAYRTLCSGSGALSRSTSNLPSGRDINPASAEISSQARFHGG